MPKDLMPIFQENLAGLALASHERVLIAVSGGPDSMALLHLFLRWDTERIGVFHLNHGFRAEAAAEAEFVRNYAKQHGIPAYVEFYNIDEYLEQSGESKQQGARRIRYKLLNECAKSFGYQRIALAHHGDDQAETVLMRLIRGSGLQGLGGIPPQRDNIIRPLLNVFKQDIIKYCRYFKIPYVEDETNLQPIYLRNKVRRELLPILEAEYNPQIASTLVQLANLVRDDEAELQSITRRLWAENGERRGDQIVFPRQTFHKLSPALQRRILRELLYLYKGNLLQIDFKHIETWRMQLERSSAFSLDLPQVEVSATQEWLFVGQYTTAQLETQTLSVPSKVQVGEYTLSVAIYPIDKLPETVGDWEDFDLARLKPPFEIRRRRPGDRMQPFASSGTKKVKDLLIDAQVPLAHRDNLPLVCDGQGILWIPTVRRSALGALTAETKQVVRFKFTRTNS